MPGTIHGAMIGLCRHGNAFGAQPGPFKTTLTGAAVFFKMKQGHPGDHTHRTMARGCAWLRKGFLTATTRAGSICSAAVLSGMDCEGGQHAAQRRHQHFSSWLSCDSPVQLRTEQRSAAPVPRARHGVHSLQYTLVRPSSWLPVQHTTAPYLCTAPLGRAPRFRHSAL